MEEWEEAIRDSRKAVDASPQDHPDRAAALRKLGLRLFNRYRELGALTDLEEAIRVDREVLKATPQDHPEWALYLGALGIALRHRYRELREEKDIQEAVELGRTALERTQKYQPDHAIYMGNLSSTLGERFWGTGDPAYIDEAIQLGRESLEATPEDNDYHSNRLNGLITLLSRRYDRKEAIADVEEAIQLGRRLLKMSVVGTTYEAETLAGLGAFVGKMYKAKGELADLKEAIVLLASVARHPSLRTVDRIRYAMEAVRYCALDLDWQQACEHSTLAIQLIRQLTPRWLENSDKQNLLRRLMGASVDAAAVALNAGKEPMAVLSLVEEGRSVLAASLEDMRTDLFDLWNKYPELAAQFVRLRDELDTPTTQVMSSTDGNLTPSLQTRSSLRSAAGLALHNLVIEIQKRPGFESFLVSPSEEEIRTAALHGPVVVVNVSQYRCDALIVEKEGVRSLALPQLEFWSLKEKVLKGSLGSLAVLAWLWETVTKPILDSLGIVERPSGENWPHIWWVPTGLLSRFPLHAAGYHHQGSTNSVLDLAMSSYGLSVKAIVQGRRRRVVKAPSTSGSSDQALIVAMQHTPEYNRLRFVEKESVMVETFCKSMLFDCVHPSQRKQEVMTHLKNCRIFHFAGHGHTNNSDPSQSSLLLEDWKDDRLTVAALMELNLRERSPFLAYLSACGTGKLENEGLSDEGIHLISGCQLAGFRHVIGTLWEVNDESCVHMARLTYEGIQDGSLRDESVCVGLHRATRELRDRWLRESASAKPTKLPREADTFALADGMDSIIIGEDNQPGSEGSRKIVIHDPDKRDERLMHWVPYVHFGV